MNKELLLVTKQHKNELTPQKNEPIYVTFLLPNLSANNPDVNRGTIEAREETSINVDSYVGDRSNCY